MMTSFTVECVLRDGVFDAGGSRPHSRSGRNYTGNRACRIPIDGSRETSVEVRPCRKTEELARDVSRHHETFFLEPESLRSTNQTCVARYGPSHRIGEATVASSVKRVVSLLRSAIQLKPLCS